MNLTSLLENSDIGDDKRILATPNMSINLEDIPANLSPADEFIGKKVIDREGIQYGKVKHIHINQHTLAVSGVTIHQGFNKDYFLPIDFIDKFTDRTLLLTRPPIRTGVVVVDIDSQKMGKVKRLHRNPDTNELEHIEITDGLVHSKIFPKSEIWGIGEKIILQLKKEDYKNFQ